MENINGEEINEDLYNKKASEKLTELDSLIGRKNHDEILKKITEYGATMFHYGKFLKGNNK